MRVHRRGLLAIVIGFSVFGCGGPPPAPLEIAPSPRRLVMWLDGGGLDLESAGRLQDAGVDQLVVRRGSIDLAGRAPVIRLNPAAPVEGAIPLAVALEVRGVRPNLDEEDADAVWRGLAAEFGSFVPAELILDLPHLAEGIEGFVSALTETSGLAVVPLLSMEQLQEEAGRRVAEAARVCIVPAFGTEDADLRGVRQLDPLPLERKLVPLAGSMVRVRPAVVIRPRTIPEIEGPLQDINRLTEGLAASVSTSSPLDRTFNIQKALTWSGRSWKAGDSIAIRWMDAARLNSILSEIHHLALPEVAGWDLVVLPDPELGLGLPESTLLNYLRGAGPAPDLRVNLERNGRSLRIRLKNESQFVTAVSNYGNWVEVSAGDDWLKADQKGGFERITLGTVKGTSWQEGDLTRVNGVRFFEIYVAPGEEILTGTVSVPSSRTQVRIRWNFSLSDGSSMVGETSG